MTSKAVHYRVCGPTQSGTTVVAAEVRKGENKPVVGAASTRRAAGCNDSRPPLMRAFRMLGKTRRTE